MNAPITQRASAPAAVALMELQQILAVPPSAGHSGRWRWSVRQHLSPVRDLLLHEAARPDGEWLAPRHGSAMRERRTLLQRLSAIAPQVLEASDVEPVRVEALRLVDDIRRHLQRRSDLAWDDVEQEFGGSE